MKLFIVFLLTVLFGVALASPAKSKSCQKACKDEYKPVCGSKGENKITFGSKCVLENYNCAKKTKLKLTKGECDGNAPIRLTEFAENNF